MARKSNRDQRRATRAIRNSATRPRVRWSPFSTRSSRPDIQVEDRRKFTPNPHSVRSLRKAHHLLRLRTQTPVRPYRHGLSFGVAFQSPLRLEICKRRHERRRVMHAKGKAGGRVRKPKWNRFSGVSC